jgi:hypothetical protein
MMDFHHSQCSSGICTFAEKLSENLTLLIIQVGYSTFVLITTLSILIWLDGPFKKHFSHISLHTRFHLLTNTGELVGGNANIYIEGPQHLNSPIMNTWSAMACGLSHARLLLPSASCLEFRIWRGHTLLAQTICRGVGGLSLGRDSVDFKINHFLSR